MFLWFFLLNHFTWRLTQAVLDMVGLSGDLLRPHKLSNYNLPLILLFEVGNKQRVKKVFLVGTVTLHSQSFPKVTCIPSPI